LVHGDARVAVCRQAKKFDKIQKNLADYNEEISLAVERSGPHQRHDMNPPGTKTKKFWNFFFKDAPPVSSLTATQDDSGKNMMM
jgi:hypothetical protein